MQNNQLFGTDGVRGRVGEHPITPDYILKLGWAVGRVLGREAGGAGKVIIGKDTRVSGYMLESALEAGLSAAGLDVHLLGPMPTPAIAYLTKTFRALAGIVISASHNPYYDNGVKLFSRTGAKLPDKTEAAIAAAMTEPMVTQEAKLLGKAARIDDAPGRYIEFCKHTVSANIALSGLHVVVDCANGATYHVAPNVFRELGAKVTVLNDKPNGFNINAHCGSTNPSILQKVVLSKGADVGLALDGDGDRLIMVDHRGEVLDGDELLYIIAKACREEANFPPGVVGTVMTNLGVERALARLGVNFQRTAVGDRHVMAELKRLGWLLGGEPSGHIVHLAKTTTGDGIIAALQVLAAMVTTETSLFDLKQGMDKLPQTIVNVPLPDRNQRQVASLPAVTQAVAQVDASLAGNGRVLLRASGTEPVIRVMVEGADADMVDAQARALAEVVAVQAKQKGVHIKIA